MRSAWGTRSVCCRPVRYATMALDRLVAEAKAKAGGLLAAGALDWLPDASRHFVGLE